MAGEVAPASPGHLPRAFGRCPFALLIIVDALARPGGARPARSGRGSTRAGRAFPALGQPGWPGGCLAGWLALRSDAERGRQWG